MLPIFPLFQKVTLVLLAGAIGLAGWQYIQIAGYKVALAETGKALDGISTQLSVCEANGEGLRLNIDRQNQAIEQAATEAALKREAALAARDTALAALEASRSDYARLRRAWPKDCVTAVSQARVELGL